MHIKQTCFARTAKKFLPFALLLLLISCSSRETVLSGVSQQDGNQLVTVLLASGIHAQKEEVGTAGLVSITVDKEQVGAALILLQNKGFPRPTYQEFQTIFPPSSFAASPTEEKARYNFFLSQSIEQTLGSINGVVLASVHVVLPQKATFLDPSLPASAGVLIKFLPSYRLDWLIPDIKNLVAQSVPGLTAENVSIVLVPEPEIKVKTDSPAESAKRGQAKETATTAENWLIIGGAVFVLLVSIFGVFLYALSKRRRNRGGGA